MARICQLSIEDPLLDMDDIEREKTLVLEELLNVRSNDFNKIEVNELILRYFESYRSQHQLGGLINFEDPWAISNQAVRQLFSASRRVQRNRYFPGSKVPVPRPGSVQFEQYKARLSAHRVERLTKLRALRSKENTFKMNTNVTSSNGIKPHDEQQEIASLAKHLVDEGLTYQNIEHDIANIAEQLTNEALDQAEVNIRLHNLASSMVKSCLERATEYLQAHGFNVVCENQSDDEQSFSRIEAIATQLVEQATNNAEVFYSENMNGEVTEQE